jgi:hypothetical protein
VYPKLVFFGDQRSFWEVVFSFKKKEGIGILKQKKIATKLFK